MVRWLVCGAMCMIGTQKYEHLASTAKTAASMLKLFQSNDEGENP